MFAGAWCTFVVGLASFAQVLKCPTCDLIAPDKFEAIPIAERLHALQPIISTREHRRPAEDTVHSMDVESCGEVQEISNP